MNQPTDHQPPDAVHLDPEIRRPFPGATREYIQGSRTDIRVPVRCVHQSGDHPDIYLYDTSGPYTDPAVDVDIRRGLPRLRAPWIEARGDTERVPAADNVNAVHGQGPHPRRAAAGKAVSQLACARRGEITPEMEFVALRENQKLEAYTDADLLRQHPAAAGSPAIPRRITPEFVRDEVAAGRAIIPEIGRAHV